MSVTTKARDGCEIRVSAVSANCYVVNLRTALLGVSSRAEFTRLQFDRFIDLLQKERAKFPMKTK
ncbi:MAG: hypothetical protein V3V96_14315 [Acidiferrobacterales bacterium]